MSSFWHWFVIIGVVGSLLAMLSLLIFNRKTSGNRTTGHTWDGIEELDNPLPMWWVWLFVGTVIFAVPFLLFFPGFGNFSGVGGWSAAKQHDAAVRQNQTRFEPLYNELGQMAEPDLHANPRAQKVGRRLFINHCSTCHGVNARGGFGFPNLTDTDWLWGDGFDAVKTAITNGRTAAMPPWGVPLGQQGVANVTQYVLQLSGAAHDSERAALGATQFATFCTACHGPEGLGNPVFGAPNLTDDIWLYGGSAGQISFTLQHGRAGNMPAHNLILSENQIHILTGYVTQLSRPVRTAQND